MNPYGIHNSTSCQVVLIINFNIPVLRNGVKRLVL
jgi:hypothetical protein